MTDKRTRKFMAVQTVKQNESMYHKREVQQAKNAREYQRRMGYCTAGKLIRLLSTGKLQNADITVQDVLRAIRIWGKDLGNLKGKTTATRAPTVDVTEQKIIQQVIQKQQVCYMDIMFVNKLPYLIVVYDPSNYVIVRRLLGRDHINMLDQIKNATTFMKKKGFIITMIRNDGESAIDSDWLKERLDENLDITGGESVPVVERKIRTIKERLRSVICTLPFIVSEQLTDWLIQNVVYFINFEPTSNTQDNRSAMEKVQGKLLNTRTDLKHGFGDYVQVGDQEIDNSM